MTFPFTFRLRVRYGECDAQKVVFNARYADYVDIAGGEFLRAIGYDYTALGQAGLDFQVVKLMLEWQGAAHFDDVVSVRVHAARIGNTSFTLKYRLSKPADSAPHDVLLCRAEGTYVMMKTPAFTKTPVPDTMRVALETGASGVVVDHGGVS